MERHIVLFFISAVTYTFICCYIFILIFKLNYGTV